MNPTSLDVKDMLEDDSSLDLTFKTDLFVGMEPTTPDNCVTIFDTPGYPPKVDLGANQQSESDMYFYPSVQIRVRNRAYDTGYALAYAIMKALHGLQGTWNSAYYGAVICVSEPFFLDWDERNLARFVLNFNLQRRVS